MVSVFAPSDAVESDVFAVAGILSFGSVQLSLLGGGSTVAPGPEPRGCCLLKNLWILITLHFSLRHHCKQDTKSF